MRQNSLEYKKFDPDWIRPNLEGEKGEIERVLQEFIGQKATQENIDKVVKILETAPIVDLSGQNWELLENTDSFSEVRLGHLEDAERITQEYNSQLSVDNRRDFKSILSGFQNGGKMEAPTILKRKDGKLHLVSGNTRLMISRGLNIRPKVVIGELG